MGFDGYRNFIRFHNWTADWNNGLNISSAEMDAEDNGFAQGLSNCITRDGQGVPTATIPWGNQQITKALSDFCVGFNQGLRRGWFVEL